MSDHSAQSAQALAQLLAKASRSGTLTQQQATTLDGERATLLDYEDDPDEPAEETAEAYARLDTGWDMAVPTRVAVGTMDGKPLILAPVLDGTIPAAAAQTANKPSIFPAGSRIIDDIGPFNDWGVRQILANPGLTTAFNDGFGTAPTLDGTVTNDDNSLGAWLRFATGTTIGTNAGIATPFNIVWSAWRPTLIVRMLTGTTDMTNQRIWVALSSATTDGSSSPSAELVGFRYDSALDGALWKMVSKNGSQTTNAGDGVTNAIAPSTVYKLKIDMTSLTQTVFSINDVIVATLTTNLPGTSTPLGVQVRIRNLAAENHFFRFRRLSLLDR